MNPPARATRFQRALRRRQSRSKGTPMRTHSEARKAAIARRLRARRRIAPMIMIVALVLGAGACKPKMNAYAPPPAAEVTVAHAIRKPVTRYLEYTGTTEAYEAVELRARVAGFLDQVNFKPGAAVKKADLLFVIDPRVYEAQARQAEAELSSREAALSLSELTLKRVLEAGQGAAVAQ